MDEAFVTLYSRDGADLVMEDELRGESDGPPMHLHPGISETFQVHSGLLTLRFPEGEHVLTPGAQATVAPGQVHSFHTRGSGPVRVTIRISPARDMELFFCGMAAAVRAGRHPLLQLAVMHQGVDDMGFYLAGPPIWAQRLLFAVLAPYARLRGYRARQARAA